MNPLNKKILTVAMLFSTLRGMAQDINWSVINLASADAKIIGKPGSHAEQNNKLIIKSFDIDEGKISIYFPPLYSGAVISGTVYTEPNGKNEKEKARNLTTLQSYLCTLGPENIPIRENSFSIPVMATMPKVNILSLKLSTATGRLLKTEELPISAPPPISTTIVPSYAVIGDANVITGSFDGKLSTTLLKIDGKPAQILAESPSSIYFNPKENTPGRTTIECTDNGKTQTAPVNVLKLDLSVPKTNLLRGQQTQLFIKVSGLEGLKENVPVIISNTSHSVISLEGGDNQSLVITPSSDAAAGVFETSRNIQSLKNGSFSVSVSITPFTSSSHK